MPRTLTRSYHRIAVSKKHGTAPVNNTAAAITITKKSWPYDEIKASDTAAATPRRRRRPIPLAFWKTTSSSSTSSSTTTTTTTTKTKCAVDGMMDQEATDHTGVTGSDATHGRSISPMMSEHPHTEEDEHEHEDEHEEEKIYLEEPPSSAFYRFQVEQDLARKRLEDADGIHSQQHPLEADGRVRSAIYKMQMEEDLRRAGLAVQERAIQA
ncbi:hypothetical protein ACA910_019405 [Epithemia clementina (nom. ined.)]